MAILTINGQTLTINGAILTIGGTGIAPVVNPWSIGQYPYILQRLAVASSTRDDNGDWSEQSTTWEDICLCRDEDGKGRIRKGQDGVDHVVSMVVQMPVGTEALKTGDTIRIVDGSEVRGTGKVLYSRKGQLHTQAWV